MTSKSTDNCNNLPSNERTNHRHHQTNHHIFSPGFISRRESHHERSSSYKTRTRDIRSTSNHRKYHRNSSGSPDNTRRRLSRNREPEYFQRKNRYRDSSTSRTRYKRYNRDESRERDYSHSINEYHDYRRTHRSRDSNYKRERYRRDSRDCSSEIDDNNISYRDIRIIERERTEKYESETWNSQNLVSLIAQDEESTMYIQPKVKSIINYDKNTNILVEEKRCIIYIYYTNLPKSYSIEKLKIYFDDESINSIFKHPEFWVIVFGDKDLAKQFFYKFNRKVFEGYKLIMDYKKLSDCEIDVDIEYKEIYSDSDSIEKRAEPIIENYDKDKNNIEGSANKSIKKDNKLIDINSTNKFDIEDICSTKILSKLPLIPKNFKDSYISNKSIYSPVKKRKLYNRIFYLTC